MTTRASWNSPLIQTSFPFSNNYFFSLRQTNNFRRKKIKFSKIQSFCIKSGLFITDLVKDISPKNFENIYNNFPDTQIETSNPSWNTQEIIAAINQFKPKKVLINFRTDNKSIPKIAGEALQIKNYFPSITFSVLSTSGAAGNKYKPLFNDWQKHIYYK